MYVTNVLSGYFKSRSDVAYVAMVSVIGGQPQGACLMSRTFSMKEHYFSLTTNQ
jgi:hypothetical protein